MPLRILYLTPYYRPYLGGIERAIEELSRQISRSPSVEAVGVLTTKYSFPRVPQPSWADREEMPDGISIYRLCGYPRRSVPLYSVPLVWFSPVSVRKYLDEFKPDVIHFVGDGWFWGHFWSWFFYRGQAQFVFTPSFHTLPASRWWLRPINAFLCHVADRVIALTGREAKGVRRAYLVPRRKLKVIGWGAPVPDEATLAKGVAKRHADTDDDLEARTLNVLCVGRLGRHKGQLWLLGAYLRARPQFHRLVRLVLVGRDEGDESAIKAFIGEHGLLSEVEVTGEISDNELAELYAEADIFTLFSQYEAFGLVFFEAMARGAPVLTHDVGANKELLGQGAIVVPRYDRQAAVRELVHLVNDSVFRQEMGKEAQEYALSEFTWPAVAEKYLEVYQEA
jgi:glycosyltransferase involved in cell wall biosynthesis